MDFGGILTLDGFSSSSSSVTNRTDALLGHKHGRSSGDFEETRDLIFAKMARTESKMCSELKREVSRSLFPNGAQMLSFSSPVKENSTSPYYYQRYPSVNELSMNNNNRIVGRVRGPFTPSQWMELEHQALIFKYIVQNAPVPTTLLVPIRRSLHSTSSFSPFSPFGSTPSGWGSLQLGYPYIAANCNGDAEPGRCRRTDGKKWRCSRDAVADQKYCERHINRGRHRSRKHVEPQRSTPAAAATGGGSVNGEAGARCLPNHQDLTRILTKETTTNKKPLETLFPNPSKPGNPFEPANGWTQQTHSNTTTNLSIAIPSSSPNNQDNPNLSPLTLSCNFNGGPLGEVLNNTSSSNIYNNNDDDMPKDHQSRSYDLPPSLNLLRDGWDLELSHNFNSSPTGVLKNNFGSVSSSNASSPRHETGTMCYDLIGSAIMKPHSITLL